MTCPYKKQQHNTTYLQKFHYRNMYNNDKMMTVVKRMYLEPSVFFVNISH
jgi:hypothetical protein